jgi:FkbM family methyltransferase
MKPGMSFYDVGANIGFFSDTESRARGGGGRVFAFDPLPSNIKAVAHNAALNGFEQIVGKPMALGKTDGEASFIVSADPNWGKLASVGMPGAVVAESKVSVRRIDSLASEGYTPECDEDRRRRGRGRRPRRRTGDAAVCATAALRRLARNERTSCQDSF